MPAGNWIGGTVDEPNSYTWVGCTVAPGFDFEDFELVVPAELMTQIPQYREINQLLAKT